jgi:hypothetical protein
LNKKLFPVWLLVWFSDARSEHLIKYSNIFISKSKRFGKKHPSSMTKNVYKCFFVFTGLLVDQRVKQSGQLSSPYRPHTSFFEPPTMQPENVGWMH